MGYSDMQDKNYHRQVTTDEVTSRPLKICLFAGIH